MRLSLFTDYSLRVLMYAALKGDAFSISEVTSAYGISRNHLVKVVNFLGRLGYLDTRRGRGGGLSLGMAPEAVRLGLLVRRTEGAPPVVECFDPKTNSCPINGMCRLKGILSEAVAAFYESLDRHTLADLVSGPWRQQLSSILLPVSDHENVSQPS